MTDAPTRQIPPPQPTGDPVADAIAQAEYRRRAAAAEWAEREERYAYEAEIADRARADLLAHCRPASPALYAEWLGGYLRAGGSISHSYDYDMPADWFEMMARPDRVPTLYGANSVHVVVTDDTPFGPEDVPRTFHGGCGHSTFYFLDGFRVVGSFVPLFRDVKALLTA